MSEMVGKLFGWVNSRLPGSKTFERHLSKHPVPSKVNFWYLFGALASVVLIIQIVSGIWLITPYSNTEEEAFASIEYIISITISDRFFPSHMPFCSSDLPDRDCDFTHQLPRELGTRFLIIALLGPFSHPLNTSNYSSLPLS